MQGQDGTQYDRGEKEGGQGIRGMGAWKSKGSRERRVWRRGELGRKDMRAAEEDRTTGDGRGGEEGGEGC